jgi:hypothetical protein
MSVNVPTDKPEKRRITFYLPPELIAAVNEEAVEAGRGVTSGRAFNPSAVVERILRAYFEHKPRARAPRK